VLTMIMMLVVAKIDYDAYDKGGCIDSVEYIIECKGLGCCC